MTDTAASASFTRPDTGEVVRPAAGFSVVLTSNVSDPDDLPTALRDRFPVAICINEAHPNALAQLPSDLREVAAAFCSATDERRASLRAFGAFAQFLGAGVARDYAARLAFGEERGAAVIEALGVADVMQAAY